MSTFLDIAEFLRPVFAGIEPQGDAVRIQTHCLYADGQGVCVTLFRTGANSWTVTDAGDGWSVLRDHLMTPSPRSAARRADAIKRNFGVSYLEGEWKVEGCSHDQIIGSILLVANASQAWVEKMFAADAVHGRAEAVEEKLHKMLKDAFGEKRIARGSRIRGMNKSYEVSTIVSLPHKQYAVFEIVTPFMASVYPAYTKFSDISHAESKPAYMAMALEGMDTIWKSDDLALLQSSGAILIDVDKGLPRNIAQLA
ncbi:hypothetical protein JK207_07675 [Gluconobacter cerinus]|uniref:hypothetical protein n=1 Tax=Gluconobacter cerinus TaxID=38307 RepID=UPI001B8AE95F|nr:hypothetical protein [Gluconobacter cerinus]MBS1021910.1 hypothetical protein [Gluconobacter cerinus]